jgi:hypothetical protein
MQNPLDEFKSRLTAVNPCRILYTGAKVWEGSVNLDHSRHVANAEWIGTDIEEGEGVEITCDLQRIDIDQDEKFNGIFSPATLEHIERPWVAVVAMANALKSGGVLFIQTHQTFPIHGYPSDHFRFSTEAMKTMCYDAGLKTVSVGYDSPCTITPPPSCTVWNTLAESYLNVSICAVKP